MEVVEVEGRDIAPEDCNEQSGWLTSHKNKNKQLQQQKEKLTQDSLRGMQHTKTYRPRIPRVCKLPENDIKIVIRLRDGFNATKVGEAQIRDAILASTGLTINDTEEDTYRTDTAGNIVITSTPSMQNAEIYCKLTSLQIEGKQYTATAYATSPDDTVKGVIQNIQSYDTEVDITNSLVNKRNPYILQARRMGKTNSVLIVFDGKKVPFQVYYRGAEYKRYVHKKKVEFGTVCGAVGHRADVCADPTRIRCDTCYKEDPEQNHDCTPQCALCGLGHATGDKCCAKRYHTPRYYTQRKRVPEQTQKPTQAETSTNPAPQPSTDPACSSRSCSKARNQSQARSGSRPGYRTNSRSTSRNRTKGNSHKTRRDATAE